MPCLLFSTPNLHGRGLLGPRPFDGLDAMQPCTKHALRTGGKERMTKHFSVSCCCSEL